MNEYFVPVEYDATETGTVPDDVPGMWVIKRAWDNSPWTRVSFGSEWVLDPTGTYIVTPPSSPDMWREHNYASISNTSVHEAYPGHHLQLSASITNISGLLRIRLATFRTTFESSTNMHRFIFQFPHATK